MNESANRLFRILVWLFLVALFAQVYLAGMAALSAQADWTGHTALGHAMAVFLIPMLIVVVVGRASTQVKLLTWALFLVWVVQVYVLAIFLRESMPWLAAFHPVLALVDFWLVLRLLAVARPVAE